MWTYGQAKVRGQSTLILQLQCNFSQHFQEANCMIFASTFLKSLFAFLLYSAQHMSTVLCLLSDHERSVFVCTYDKLPPWSGRVPSAVLERMFY